MQRHSAGAFSPARPNPYVPLEAFRPLDPTLPTPRRKTRPALSGRRGCRNSASPMPNTGSIHGCSSPAPRPVRTFSETHGLHSGGFGVCSMFMSDCLQCGTGGASSLFLLERGTHFTPSCIWWEVNMIKMRFIKFIWIIEVTAQTIYITSPECCLGNILIKGDEA